MSTKPTIETTIGLMYFTDLELVPISFNFNPFATLVFTAVSASFLFPIPN